MRARWSTRAAMQPPRQEPTIARGDTPRKPHAMRRVVASTLRPLSAAEVARHQAVTNTVRHATPLPSDVNVSVYAASRRQRAALSSCRYARRRRWSIALYERVRPEKRAKMLFGAMLRSRRILLRATATVTPRRAIKY